MVLFMLIMMIGFLGVLVDTFNQMSTKAKVIVIILIVIVPSYYKWKEYKIEQNVIAEREAKSQAEKQNTINLSKELISSGKDFKNMNYDEKTSIIYLLHRWDEYDQDFKNKYESQKELLEKPVREEENKRDDEYEQQKNDADMIKSWYHYGRDSY